MGRYICISPNKIISSDASNNYNSEEWHTDHPTEIMDTYTYLSIIKQYTAKHHCTNVERTNDSSTKIWEDIYVSLQII